jgi:transcriptional regulator of acetoin/glycerol metabolism
MLARRREAEREAVVAALERAGGRCTRAAADLGIDKATLYRKIKTYSIDLDSIRELKNQEEIDV